MAAATSVTLMACYGGYHDPPCQGDDCPEGGICDDAQAISGDVTQGDTNAGSDLTDTCAPGLDEQVFTLTVTGNAGEEQYVTASVDSDVPHHIEVRNGCQAWAAELECAPAGTGNVAVVAQPGDVLWLVVEAEQAGGPFELRTRIQPLVCGDGLVVGNEACDDGNLLSGDGCNSLCEVEGSQ